MKYIFLPGMDGTGELYKPFTKQLSGIDFEVINLNHFSESTYSFLTTALVEKLNNENMVLIAESFSGPLALNIASRLGSKVKAVCICASFVSSPVGKIFSFAPWKMLFSFRPPKFLVKHYLIGDCDSKSLNSFYLAIQAASASNLAARLRAVFSLRPDQLPELSIPVLYLEGTEDRLIGPQSVKKFKKKYPHSVIKKIQGPHLLMQTQPDKCLKEIEDFCKNKIAQIKV